MEGGDEVATVPAESAQTPESDPAPEMMASPLSTAVPTSVYIADDDGDEDEGDAGAESEAAGGDGSSAMSEEERRQRKEKVLRKLETDHLNIVFIGHVDAGKSTTAGNILVLTGQVDERTIEKYERAAKETNRGSWFLAFIMDVNDEERAKGITVEVGRATFQTEKRRFTILDAPGHKSYVPNMISGAAQADVAVLVITARRGEFEAGFDKGGQTREHAMLAVTLGVSKLVVFVNKMDESTVMWSKERYDEIVDKLTPFIKMLGFRRNDVFFLPGSGLTGLNLKDRVPADVCSWYTGPTLFELLDAMELPPRSPDGALRMPILDKMKEGGRTFYMGKLESGTLRVGDTVVVQPGRMTGTVTGIIAMEVEIDEVGPGDNIRVALAGVPEDNVHGGCVISDPGHVVRAVSMFEAQLQIVDVLAHKPVISPGYKAVLHAHTASDEATIDKLVSLIDKKSKSDGQKNPRFVKKGDLVNARFSIDHPLSLDLFREMPQLGRFTLRDEGVTIAIGRITKLPKDKV